MLRNGASNMWMRYGKTTRDTRDDLKTSQSVSRSTYGAPTKQKNRTQNRNRTRDKTCH